MQTQEGFLLNGTRSQAKTIISAPDRIVVFLADLHILILSPFENHHHDGPKEQLEKFASDQRLSRKTQFDVHLKSAAQKPPHHQERISKQTPISP